MNETFEKLPDAVNKGTDYEVLSIANMVLDFVNDKKIKEFKISSNDKNFGVFDDIVTEVEFQNDKQIYALQLKHSDRGNLFLNQLTQAKGNFSIKKYFDSAQNIKIDKATFILYTNLKFNIQDNTKFHLVGEKFPITVTKIDRHHAFEILRPTNCYKFAIKKDGSCENSDAVLLYEKFFENFLLYTNQDNIDNVRRNVIEKFNKFFGGNETECNQYERFLKEWSLKKGEKIDTLNKNWMRSVIALKILSSRIKPLSFNNTNNIASRNSTNTNILRKAVGAFDVTIFKKKSYDDLKDLWSDAKCELNDLKIINNFRTKYHLSSTYISDINNVDSLTVNILLWLLGKCPLILDLDANLQIYKILDLCVGKKYILLEDNRVSSFSANISLFTNLFDLKKKTIQYDQLVQNFRCSLQGKEQILLGSLIKDDEELLTVLETDDLLEMCKGQCRIEEERESLPEPYIERTLQKNCIDIKILDNFTKETVIILDCVAQKQDLKNQLKRHKLIDNDDIFNTQNTQTKPSNFQSSFEKNPHTDISNLNACTIYFSGKRCQCEEFNALCSQYKNGKNFHQFRLRDDKNLEWIRSRGDVSEIEKYKLSECYSIQERDSSLSEPENNINLLTSDPGMGKSALMASFKINCFSNYFTVIVDPKIVFAFLKDTPKDTNYAASFQKFLLKVQYNTLPKRDKAIFQSFLKTNKIVYMWDALDELLDEHREIVIKTIMELSENCVQWVTSRCHLENMLQQKFNVLSLHLSKFDKEEQKKYIRKRLTGTDSIEKIVEKIKDSFVLIEHQDILGIPLQLFMLTELFRRDQDKYLNLLNDFFLLTDLYKYFIDEKLNIYSETKLGLSANTAMGHRKVQEENEKMLEEITHAALRLLFPDTFFKELTIQNKDDFRKIQETHLNTGLVTEVKDQVPRFLHNSFAEYLAARYFENKLENKNVLKEVIFDPKYKNVRFFFDLLLARDSKAHVAILYKDVGFIKSCDIEMLTKTDSVGRSVLHLACSWGQAFSERKVRWRSNTYIIDDEGLFNPAPESTEFLEIINRLLELCDMFQPDKMYRMTPAEYARKAKCLAVEMKIFMNSSAGKELLQIEHIINMLYYSVCCGYFDELEFFCQESGINQIKSEITSSVNVNIKTSTGENLLHLAAQMGHVKIVEYLVEAGVDVNLADKNGVTPLFIASYRGYDQIVKVLVLQSADVNLAQKDGVTPLHMASQNGHDQIVEVLVAADADVNLAHKDGITPLFMASQNGHDKIVEVLVSKSADVNIVRKDGATPLHMASQNEHDKIVKVLVSADADVNLADKDGITPLYMASQNGHDQIVEVLVAADADVNLADKDGITPLFMASQQGHDKIVEYLVEASVDVNLADKYGVTPLHMASLNGHDKIVKVLVMARADVNLAQKDGITPLFMASQNGHDKIVEVLVMARADVNIAREGGATPLHMASQQGHDQIVEVLVTADADVNLADKDGITPLFMASQNGHGKIVEVLVSKSADVNIARKGGVTPLHMASQQGHDKIVEVLVMARADVNIVREDGATPLHMASQNGHDKIAEVLVSAGADVNLADEDGITPLHMALQNTHNKIVDFLLEAGARG